MTTNLYLSEEERRECEWLDSEGFLIVKVNCAKCGREYEEVVHKVRLKIALKKDVFLCQSCTTHKEASFLKERFFKIENGTR